MDQCDAIVMEKRSSYTAALMLSVVDAACSHFALEREALVSVIPTGSPAKGGACSG